MTLSRLLRISRHRVRSIFKKAQVDAELRKEVDFHLHQLVSELEADGLSAEEADRQARRVFGSVAFVEQTARAHRRIGWLEDFWEDWRFGVRMLQKHRGFTAIAATSLALGIGANTAVLGAMNELLGGLPFPESERLVMIRTFSSDNPQRNVNATVADYLAWKTRSHSFEAVGASLAEQTDLGSERDGTPAQRLSGQGVTPSVFQALNVAPLFGRVFTDADAQSGRPAPVIVVSHGFWKRRFGGDRNVLNTSVRLDGVASTIIGVMPPEFRYPIDNVDYWAPLALNDLQRDGSRFFLVTARLRRGLTVQQAQADVVAVSTQLAQELPGHEGWGARVVSMRESLLGWTGQRLLTFEAAVLLVLLIACANVTCLLLARGSVRESEIAIRAALGAGHGRIIRQLLAEGVLLAVIGALLGVLVAWWGLGRILTLVPPPGGLRIGVLGLNASTLAIAAVLSVASGLVFGIVPALAAVKVNLIGSLNESVRGTGTQARGHRVRAALVAAQIALALVLLTGAGLLIKSVVRLTARDLNFEPQGLLTFEVRVPADEYRAGMLRDAPYARAFPPSLTMERIYEGLRGIPGAESVAGISIAPVNSLLVPTMTIVVDGRPRPETNAERAAAAAKYFLVTPNFFATMKAQLLRGREFDADDRASTEWRAVINETAARRFWPGQDPIGRRFRFDVVSGERPRTVVGVVRDIPLRSAYFDNDAVIYASFLQQASEYRGPFAFMFGQMTFLIRNSANPMAMLSAARRVMAEVDPDRALGRVMLMQWYIGGGLLDRAASVLVLAIFAGTATLLAAIGIYGVMAYSVAQRTREIGIRMALGASAREVVGLVGRNVLMLAAVALPLGLAGSLAFARLIASQLWEVTPTDPATYASATLLFGLVALVATYLPLRRAMKVDPTVALRYE